MYQCKLDSNIVSYEKNYYFDINRKAVSLARGQYITVSMELADCSVLNFVTFLYPFDGKKYNMTSK